MIAVMTTAKNVARFLPVWWESLRLQTMKDFRVYCCDDGSDDGTAEALEGIADSDRRVVLLPPEDVGRYKALKRLERAMEADATKIKYVTWVDADDWIDTHTFDICTRAIRQFPGYVAGFAGYSEHDEDGRFLRRGHKTADDPNTNRLLYDFHVFGFQFVPYDAFVAAGGFDPEFPVAGDYDLALRIQEFCPWRMLKPYPLLKYRRHGGSISATRRPEQIYWSAIASQKALDRRMLSGRFQLSVDKSGKFKLLAI